MRLALLATSFLACAIATAVSAQLPPAKTDPLAKPPAGQGTAACSATEASCAEAAAKILPQVMGPSPLEENLRRVTGEGGGSVTGCPEMANASDWRAAVDGRSREVAAVPAHKYRRRNAGSHSSSGCRP